MTNELLKPVADALTAPTAVGSGDLLGSKVIKLNRIKGTQTIGVQICSLLETGASFLFKAGNFRLPAQT
jgi:hypothetical protein